MQRSQKVGRLAPPSGLSCPRPQSLQLPRPTLEGGPENPKLTRKKKVSKSSTRTNSQKREQTSRKVQKEVECPKMPSASSTSIVRRNSPTRGPTVQARLHIFSSFAESQLGAAISKIVGSVDGMQHYSPDLVSFEFDSPDPPSLGKMGVSLRFSRRRQKSR